MHVREDDAQQGSCAIQSIPMLIVLYHDCKWTMSYYSPKELKIRVYREQGPWPSQKKLGEIQTGVRKRRRCGPVGADEQGYKLPFWIRRTNDEPVSGS